MVLYQLVPVTGFDGGMIRKGHQAEFVYTILCMLRRCWGCCSFLAMVTLYFRPGYFGLLTVPFYPGFPRLVDRDRGVFLPVISATAATIFAS